MRHPPSTACAACGRIVFRQDADANGRCCFCVTVTITVDGRALAEAVVPVVPTKVTRMKVT